MKNRIILSAIIALSTFGFVFGIASATTVFNSNQVGTSPVAGSVLQTNGATSTWVATSSLGISSTFARSATKTVCAYNALDTTNCDYKATQNTSDVAIQAAINAVTSTAGTVKLIGPNFTVATSVIVSNSNISIVGDGWGTQVLAANNLNGPIFTTSNGSLLSGLSIQNLQINGNRTNQTSGDCIDARAVDQSIFINDWITQCKGAGIAFTGTAGGTYGYNNWIQNDLFDGNGVNGVTFSQNDENFIQSNLFKTLTGDNILDGAGLQIIQNNTFEGVSATSGRSIYEQNNSNDLIQGNTFDGPPTTAIQVDGSSTVITNNNFYNCANSVAAPCVLIKVGTQNVFNNNIVHSGGMFTYALDEQVNPGVLMSGNSLASGSSGIFAAVPSSKDQDFFNVSSGTPGGAAYYGQVNGTTLTFNVPTGSNYNLNQNGSTLFPSSLVYGTSTGNLTPLTIGTNLSISGGTLNATGGSGSSTFARSATKVVCASNAVDVTNCDYKASGTNDDLVINQATNAVSSTGGVIYLSEGTFNISTSSTGGVRLYSNESLVGAGASTILKSSASSSANDVFVATSTNVIIENFAINGNSANTNQPGIGVTYQQLNGVYITSSTNVLVQGLFIQNAYQAAIYAESSNNIIINNNRAQNGGDNGIFIHPSVANQQSSNITISNNIVSGDQFSGIQAIRASYITITGNVSYNNGPTAGQGDGVGVEGCSYVTINGNVTYGNGIQGINVRFTNEGGATTTSQYVTVTGNTVYNETSSNGDAGGISISAASGTLVSNNNIYNTYYGISANSGGSGINPTDISITGNKVLNSISWGIYINNNNQSNILVSNDQVASSSGGLYTQALVSIQGGSYTGNSGDGIVISGTGANSSTIQGVTLYDNTNNAIEMENNVVNVSVINNYCTNVVGKNQGRCLYEDSGSGPTHMINNYIVNQANQPYFFNNAASTFQTLDNGSGQTVLNTPTSTLLLTGSTGIIGGYGGSNCTNQGVSGISATGTVKCATFATSTIIAGGTATGPAITFATSTVTNAFTIVCGTATCTFTIPPAHDTFYNPSTFVSTVNGASGAILTITTSTALANTDIDVSTAVNTIGNFAGFTYANTTGLFSAPTGTLTNLNLTNGTSTNFTVTTLKDASGNKYVTSTTSGVSSVNSITGGVIIAGAGSVAVSSSSQTITITGTTTPSVATTTKSIYDISPTSTDNPDFVENAPLGFTIREVDCYNDNATGNTFLFNVLATTTLTTGLTYPSSSLLFAANQTCTATGTVSTLTSFANASVLKGQTVRLWFPSAASSTGAHVQIDY